MAKPWICAVLNFFFSGLGYAVFGPKRFLGILWTLAALGLTYVELSIQTAAPDFYWPMFASVFVLNTAFAIDGYRTLAAEAGQATAVRKAA